MHNDAKQRLSLRKASERKSRHPNYRINKQQQAGKHANTQMHKATHANHKPTKQAVIINIRLY
jgi:hypothetical protein